MQVGQFENENEIYIYIYVYCVKSYASQPFVDQWVQNVLLYSGTLDDNRNKLKQKKVEVDLLTYI